MPTVILTQARLKELLHYDPETGLFTWKVSRGCAKANSVAGFLFKSKRNNKPYLNIGVDGYQYFNHRLAWLYVHGEFPSDQIDHINSNGFDNRIVNLRDVTNAINGKNQCRSINNASGVTGVRWHSIYKKWTSSVRSEGKTIHLGNFNNFNDAVIARKMAEYEHGFHPNHGNPSHHHHNP